MSTSFLTILVLVFSAGALLAAWAGIRSIQSARTVVFYRTRQSRMQAGWIWLAASLTMGFFATAALFFGKPLINQVLSSGDVSTSAPVWTSTLPPTSSLTVPPLPSQTSALLASSTSTISTAPSTQTAEATPSRTPSYLGTYTAFAIFTERKSTFIAMLSFTPTASRTPIPTWTRTPSSTPRPTYTASPTRTPRTPPATWTLSPTPSPRPTYTASATRTPSPTRTPSRTPTVTRTVTPTP